VVTGKCLQQLVFIFAGTVKLFISLNHNSDMAIIAVYGNHFAIYGNNNGNLKENGNYCQIRKS